MTVYVVYIRSVCLHAIELLSAKNPSIRFLINFKPFLDTEICSRSCREPTGLPSRYNLVHTHTSFFFL
jgi:hypothetical protein